MQNSGPEGCRIGRREDGVAPEERHGLAVRFSRDWGLSPLRIGVSLALADKLVGVTDRDAMFALAHVPPRLMA
jgi:hypothetical protein